MLQKTCKRNKTACENQWKQLVSTGSHLQAHLACHMPKLIVNDGSIKVTAKKKEGRRHILKMDLMPVFKESLHLR